MCHKDTVIMLQEPDNGNWKKAICYSDGRIVVSQKVSFADNIETVVLTVDELKTLANIYGFGIAN